MKNAKRKQVWVTMYGLDGQEISVMLTKLDRNVCNMTGNIWYIPERTFNQLLDDYITVSFQRPDTDTVTRLPYGIQRVIVLRRDDTYYDLSVTSEFVKLRDEHKRDEYKKMKKKKMIDVWVYDQSEDGEYIRLYNIEGTDDYYVSGKAFDAKDRRHIGGLYFDNPNRWTVDRNGDYHPITDLPDYVRDIYFMVDGEIIGKTYENPNYRDIVTR